MSFSLYFVAIKEERAAISSGTYLYSLKWIFCEADMLL